jgi:hypothetical protein
MFMAASTLPEMTESGDELSVSVPKRGTVASPTAVLRFAEKAPRKINIREYDDAIRVLRQKNYSWRKIVGVLDRFGVKVSHVHLQRLYGQEEVSLSVRPSPSRQNHPVMAEPEGLNLNQD